MCVVLDRGNLQGFIIAVVDYCSLVALFPSLLEVEIFFKH